MTGIQKLLWIAGCFVCRMAVAQPGQQDSIAHDRIHRQQNNAYILGTWAAANLVQGTISASNTQGSEHFFHQMNAYWNIGNLAVAGIGLLRVKQLSARQYAFAGNLKAQQQVEKTLLLGTGLDMAYIMTGLYLKERGNRLDKVQSQGYGGSLLLQGSFLLVFDVIQYFNHRRNGRLLEQQLGQWEWGPKGAGLGLSYRFR